MLFFANLSFDIHVAYRVTLFNRLRTLISLDGMDKHGKKDMKSQGLTGTEFMNREMSFTRKFLVQELNSMWI